MSNIWGLALGILFFAIWIVFLAYWSAAKNAYIQGRIDQIRHKNLQTAHTGIARLAYKQGRKNQAKRHRLRVHERMAGRDYGNFIPR